jgi:hypothetical protein
VCSTGRQHIKAICSFFRIFTGRTKEEEEEGAFILSSQNIL